ncbi:NmrA-like family protein [Colletotrichum karsti]|uniref:NmrA-like family protein n=1 Tax=Colletotrichum karsti TaxID=1095194 RepID=A0A9P6I184_9PEZI|nr:NmrA-like family protein [Colletotrichum karsti]KAF9874578.1 NmrA-like family protein [Colletotrichum karsti]
MATYLITQATGQQSLWAILYLLESGAKIHGLVRDLEKVPSNLRNPNITLFQGESKNLEDVFRAAQGCNGVFLNTVPYPGLELLQAKTVVEACEKAGVDTIVAATTHNTGMKEMWDDDATRNIGLHDYFSSKAAVEDTVRTGKFRAYTILRPAVLHHDFHLPGSLGNFPRLSTHGVLDHLLEDGVKLPFTDTSDVGKYIAAALQDPAKFGGEEIDLGNQLLTIEEAQDILTKISGREVQVAKRTLKEVEEMGISAFGQRFHLFANIKNLIWARNNAKDVQRRFGIPFTSVSEALQRDSAKVLECLPGKRSA